MTLRIGLHVNADRSIDQAIDYCATVKPAMMKWLAPNRAVIDECRRRSPGTLHVGRLVHNPQDLGGAYESFRRRLLDYAREHPECDYVETYNEPAWHGRDLAAYARAEVKTAEALNAIGRGVLLGGFSTGFLDLGDAGQRDYAAWRPVLDYCHRVGGKLAAIHGHEYSGPYVQYMTRTPDGRNQWDHERDVWTGTSADPALYESHGLDGWLTLRYRMLRDLLIRDGLTGVRMAITESGIDDVNPRPGGANRKGWRDYDGTEWSRLPGIGDYAEQMGWYARQLSRDHPTFIIGAVDFGFGTIDPAWNSFDLAQAPDMFARFTAAQAAIGGTQPPPPPPIPAPQPPAVPAPPTATGVEARIVVLRGEGWTAIARRALGREPKVAEVTALREANREVAGLTPGVWIRSPFHKVVPR